MLMRNNLIAFGKTLLPPRLRSWLVQQQKRYRLQRPRAGNVNFGSFDRLTPISPIFGIDRGIPIDRYYIEKFLEENADAIRGRALELGDAFYINKFGAETVEKIDVLHVTEGSPEATIIADLTDADHIPSDAFDCIIFTQTLQMIYDLKAALRTLHRILKPGGVLLLTSHGISKIGRHQDRDDWGEYWHITTQAARSLFDEIFFDSDVEISSLGNVYSAMCSLHGLAADELTSRALDFHDPDFEVLVTVRARKRTSPQ